jgi:uncharacterized metal-binding protein
MESSCCSVNNGETLIFTCAGAAHTGQVANRAGIQLMQQRSGKLFCIAAVGAGVGDKTDRARAAARRVVIDGCDDHCCKKILEKAGLTVDCHIIVTDLGIEKHPAEPHLVVDTKRVVDHATAALGG